MGGQPVQGLSHGGIGKGHGLGNGLALDHLGGHGGGGDGGTTAEGLELHVGNDVAVHLQVHLHDVAALGVAHLAYPIGVLDLSHVAGMLKMVHHFI